MRAVRRVSGRAGQAQMKFRYLIRENTKQDFYLAILGTNKHTPFFSARADSWAPGFQITVGTQSAIAVGNPRSDSVFNEIANLGCCPFEDCTFLPAPIDTG